MSTYPEFLVRIDCITYNHAPYIEDAMNGFCMQQTTFPFVATIIDDASTDGEPEVIRRYLDVHFDLSEKGLSRQWETDDAYFIYAQHRENKNCYFAIVLLKYNFWQAKKSKEPLIKEWTNTKYVAFCEGDDYWIVPHKLQKQVDVLNAHPECSFCGTGFIEKKIEKLDRDYTIVSPNSEMAFYDIRSFGRKWIGKTLTLLVRNTYYIIYLKESRKYKAPKDTYLLYHLLKQGNCVYIPKPMGVYNNNGQGIWNSKTLAEKIVWDTNTMRELYLKNNRDKDIYDLYINYLNMYVMNEMIKGRKFRTWFEGITESMSFNDRKLITVSFLSVVKKNVLHFLYRCILPFLRIRKSWFLYLKKTIYKNSEFKP